MADVPTLELLREIRTHYRLSWWGIHGVSHWARVFENGVRLTAVTGARLDVVRLFAVFHDCDRWNEDHDPEHGRRGAQFAARLRGKAFELSDEDFVLLETACVHHTDGQTVADVTVQTCWDADRLDLGRVGIKPQTPYLCTEAAKDPQMIDWAFERSISNFLPKFVIEHWERA